MSDRQKRVYMSPAAQGKEVSVLGEGFTIPKKTPEEIERDRIMWAALSSTEPIEPTNYILFPQGNFKPPFSYREPHIDLAPVIVHFEEGSDQCDYITSKIGVFRNKATNKITGFRVDKIQDIIDAARGMFPEFERQIPLGYILIYNFFDAKRCGNEEVLNELGRKCLEHKLMVNIKPSIGEIAYGEIEFTEEQVKQLEEMRNKPVTVCKKLEREGT